MHCPTKNIDTIYKSNVAADNDPRRFCIDWIEPKTTILDVGCACGDFGNQLKAEKNCEIYGLEYNVNSIEIAKQQNSFVALQQIDLNNFDINEIFGAKIHFDYIVFGDVLEHLLEPELVVKKLQALLKTNGHMLISLPNIAHASIKCDLLLNNFTYADTGILDRTHIKFYTYKSIAKLLAHIDLEISDCNITDWLDVWGNHPPYSLVSKNILKDIFADKHSFVVQYVVKTKVSNSHDLEERNMQVLNSITLKEKKPIRSLEKTFIDKALGILSRKIKKLLTNN